ncbi:MAG: winged helix-turn-helix domain-containing protein [Eubacteriales bacterium]|nr:winged helix-turn-helix domain-containing protein [Eubacteriales bacterium]
MRTEQQNDSMKTDEHGGRVRVPRAPHKRVPAYVVVYNRLRELLDNRTFPVGSRLPTEPKLAIMLETNRETLRQALALLREDEMIKSVRGSGNYVISPHQTIFPSLNKLGNPVAKCLIDGYDKVDVEFSVEEPNEYAKKLFNKELKKVISAYQYYYREDKLIVYTYTVVDIGWVEDRGIEVKTQEEFWQFMDHRVYELAKRSHIEVPLGFSGDVLWPQPLKRGQRLTYMIEKLYEDEVALIVCNKHYLLSNECMLSIEAN